MGRAFASGTFLSVTRSEAVGGGALPEQSKSKTRQAIHADRKRRLCECRAPGCVHGARESEPGARDFLCRDDDDDDRGGGGGWWWWWRMNSSVRRRPKGKRERELELGNASLLLAARLRVLRGGEWI